MDNSLTYLLLAGIGFIVTVPVLLYLFHRFWQLRSHFVISRRLPQFSISIVILSMISYSIGIYPFVLRYLGMIETETEWLEHLAVPTAMAQVITAIILYRAYLIYVRGKRASRALTKNIDELHSIYYNDDDIEQDSKTSNSIRSRPSLPKRASVQKERKLVVCIFCLLNSIQNFVQMQMHTLKLIEGKTSLTFVDYLCFVIEYRSGLSEIHYHGSCYMLFYRLDCQQQDIFIML